MLSTRVVRMIELHSDELAADVVERLRHSSRTAEYLKLPKDELRHDAARIYRHLGDWLLTKSETEVEFSYTQLGMARARQGIPIGDFVWALIIIKENLWRYLQANLTADRAFELYGELEFAQLVNRFFDRALYYGTLGYGRAEGKEREAVA